MPRFPCAVVSLLLVSSVAAQTFDPPRYDPGTPVFSNWWVNPVTGSDAASGTSSNQALRTLAEAWSRIPMHVTLSNVGHRILLLPGDYAESAMPGYWESRHGSYNAPVVVQAHGGPGSLAGPLASSAAARPVCAPRAAASRMPRSSSAGR